MQTLSLTVFQIKAARRAIGLTFHELSEKTGVAVSALARMESSDLYTFPEHSNVTTVYKVRECLENHGIEFKEGNWVRLIPKSEQFTIRVKDD